MFRAQLIQRGYRPARLKHDHSGYECDVNHFCERYPEVLLCSGIGLDLCEFVFIRPKSREYYVVMTTGESEGRKKVIVRRRATKSDLNEIRDNQAN